MSSGIRTSAERYFVMLLLLFVTLLGIELRALAM
jgi:hypothetical protein